MIIKSKRIRARGPALKRALQHIQDGEDNDEVVLLRGNLADLEDARSDALQFGRQYCLRHWIASPSEVITPELLDDLIQRLAVEFGFNTQRICVWRHTKNRATENGCPQHFHILVPEVDPISGRVMSSSHDYDRQSKISVAVEVAWGHGIVAPPRLKSVVAALERDGDYTTAAALENVVSPDHPASFGEVDHQRSKRNGLDLPRIREMVSEALTSATSRGDFDARLAKIGLRLRTGDEKDVLIVETIDETLVGSLARLTRLRKAALEERMKFDAAKQSAAPTDHPSGHLSLTAKAGEADAAGGATGLSSDRPERARSDKGYDRAPPAGGGRDRAGSVAIGGFGVAPGRAGGNESDQGRRARLKLTAGCVRHQNSLLDLLGAARHAALPPLERAVSDLNDVIEQETTAMRAAELPEPQSLLAARKAVEEATIGLQRLQDKRDAIAQRLANHPSQPIWARLFVNKIDPDRQGLESRSDDLGRKIQAARTRLATTKTELKAEDRKFRIAQAQHEKGQSARHTLAQRQIAVAQLARAMVEKSPRSALWGAARLMQVAAQIHTARAAHSDEPTDDWDLIPRFDLWGIPYLPPPPRIS